MIAAASRRLGPSKRRSPASSSANRNGQALAFVYCEDETGRRTTAKLLTRDEARRIAVNIPSYEGCWAPRQRRMRKPLVYRQPA
jgi:hypothetical protein